MDESQIRRSAPRGVSPLGGSGGPPPKVGPPSVWFWLIVAAVVVGIVWGGLMLVTA